MARILSWLCLLPCALGVCSLQAANVSAADACVSCHASIQQRARSHGPVAMGTCDICHTNETPQTDPKKHHTFTLSQEQPALCLSCHEDMRAKLEGYKVKHQAIEAGGCTACHDPHGSTSRYFLKEQELDKTCSACHDSKTTEAVVHKPVKTSCALCHNPHGSELPKLLKALPQALCLECHGKMLKGKSVHPPAKASCLNCHDPHSSPRPRMLKADPKTDLCFGCHKTIKKTVQESPRPHKAIAVAGCLACHNPHSSDQAPLLKSSMGKVCVACHEGKRAELNSRFLHGPVKMEQCQGCHSPHGGRNPSILKAYFPPSFYNSYKENLYKLCFNCHEKDIADRPRTTTLTNFRDGSRNLHYLHVHSSKGRSCKACHEVHGGNQEKHIRTQVPFGSWMLPIEFTKTPTGGGCTTGCHGAKKYDRVKPLVSSEIQ